MSRLSVLSAVFAATCLSACGSSVRPAPPVPVAVVGVSSAAASSSSAAHRDFRLPVFMYHYIRTMPGPKDKLGQGLTVTPPRFEEQLQLLQKNAYRTIGFADVLSGSGLMAKSVILTFDDGYEDAYTAAFPALKAHHLKGVFYIVTGFVGKPGYMTWEQIKEMHDAGMEIGAHTVSHLDLPTLPPTVMRSQIVDSVKSLREHLGINVVSFAYPAGKYNTHVLDAVRAVGIHYAVTTHFGTATSAQPPLELKRLRIDDTVKIGVLLP